MKFEPEQLIELFKSTLQEARLNEEDRTLILTEVTGGLQGYTYLE